MAIDPNIKKKADDIRNKVYGKEVRESLASGLEEMSSDVVENEGRQSVVESRQDSVESQFQDVIENTTDKDVISAPEIIAARNGKPNLKRRIDDLEDETTAQLAQNVSYLNDFAIRVKSNGTDDTLNISNALDEIISKGHGTLFLPDDRYYVSGVKKVGTPDNSLGFISLIGGESTQIFLIDNSNKHVLHLEFLDYFRMVNIEVDGNKENQSEGQFDGVFIRYCKDLIVTTNKSHNCKNNGFTFRGIKKIFVENNEAYENCSSPTLAGDGMLIYALAGTVSNNKCWNNNQTPKGFKGSYDGDGIQYMHGMGDVPGWYEESKSLNFIHSQNNFCYENGRRGIKYQRPRVISSRDVCTLNGTKQMSVVHEKPLHDVFIFNPILGDDETISEATFSVEGVSEKHKNIKLIGGFFKGVTTNHAIDIHYCDDFEIKDNDMKWLSVNGFEYMLRENSENGIVKDEAKRINDLGVNNSIPEQLVDNIKGRMILLEKNTTRKLLDIQIPLNQSVGLTIDFMVSQVDFRNNLPITSSNGFGSTGRIFAHGYCDSGGNITISPLEIIETKSSDGITFENSWSLKETNGKLNLNLLHENSSSNDNITASLSMDVKLFKNSHHSVNKMF